MIRAGARLYLTSEGATELVLEGDERAASLWKPEGEEITAAEAERYGIGSDGMPAAEEKGGEPESDKSSTPATTKPGTKRGNKASPKADEKPAEGDDKAAESEEQ